MIKLKDSFKIAKIKFKTRKVRNAFSGCAISLGIILILVIIFGTSGIISLASKVFKNSISSDIYARDSYPTAVSPDEFYGNKNESSVIYDPTLIQEPQKINYLTKSEYKDRYSDFKIVNIFESKIVNTSQFIISGTKISQSNQVSYNQSSSFPIMSTEELFIKDYLYKGYNFGDNYGNKIPIILPKDYLISIEYGNGGSLSNKDKFNRTKEVLDKYIGKTIKLSGYEMAASPKEINSESDFKDIDIEFIVVGFSNSGIFGTDSAGSAFTIPNWSLEKNTNLKTIFSGNKYSNISLEYTIEFQDKGERDRFLKRASESRIYSVEKVVGKFELFAEPLRIIKKVGLAIGGFLLLISALFILTTVAKIVADSRKEIGVFRAIGAQKKDIKRIFFSYSFLLTTFGFLLGFVIALIFNSVISLIWGSQIFYSIANYGTNSSFTKPLLVLVGFPVLQILLVYVFTLLIGFLASYFPIRKAAKLDPIKALREE